MPPVVTFHPLGFIVREEARKDIIAQLLKVEGYRLHGDGWGREGFHRSIEQLGRVQGRPMVTPLWTCPGLVERLSL
ncbi:MAG: hypothetical protein K5821_11660 [Nitrobacter sp.]|uniref:hypothetical protein n=1 Tax=Nitrobacter sp. TaxID=29420 RepID=UPI002609209E|nr:hypothetical protein [Nitrobacter sp.]MCV0387071.1 hypothetical protein [Nitrobacter sp.]